MSYAAKYAGLTANGFRYTLDGEKGKPLDAEIKIDGPARLSIHVTNDDGLNFQETFARRGTVYQSLVAYLAENAETLITSVIRTTWMQA